MYYVYVTANASDGMLTLIRYNEDKLAMRDLFDQKSSAYINVAPLMMTHYLLEMSEELVSRFMNYTLAFDETWLQSQVSLDTIRVIDYRSGSTFS